MSEVEHGTGKLRVSEHFYSIQGEGKTCGAPSIFLRLGGCNLMCGGIGTERDGQLHEGAKWRCDTIEVWTKSKSYTYRELVNELDRRYKFTMLMQKGVHLVITGGEPLLQQKDIVGFIRYVLSTFTRLKAATMFVEIETNGTVMPSAELEGYVSVFNVSPKLRNSGVESLKRVRPEVLKYFSNLYKTCWKFVIADKQDAEEIEALLDTNQSTKIWLMPAASNRQELQERIPVVASIAMDMKVNMCTRLQVHIWNETVGV